MGIPFLEDVLGRISEATHAVPSGVAALPVVGAPIASAVATSALVQSVTDDRGAFDDEMAVATADADAERARAWGERDALTAQTSSLEYSEHAIVDDDRSATPGRVWRADGVRLRLREQRNMR